jgi:hypothetical protein
LRSSCRPGSGGACSWRLRSRAARTSAARIGGRCSRGASCVTSAVGGGWRSGRSRVWLRRRRRASGTQLRGAVGIGRQLLREIPQLWTCGSRLGDGGPPRPGKADNWIIGLRMRAMRWPTRCVRLRTWWGTRARPFPRDARLASRCSLCTRQCSRSARTRHFVTAITGGGWVLCEVKALSHGTKGQSNGYHRFGYYRRDRIRRLVGLYGCAVEGWEGGCACGVGSDLTACDYVAVASRRNTGRILTERYRGFRATCNSPSPLLPACDPALALRSPALAVRRDFRHFVTAITGGGWVPCEVEALSHGTKGQSNA